MKKTKVERTSERLEKENARLAGLVQKKEEIEAEIASCTDRITALKKQLEHDKIELFMKLMKSSGISLDELVSAAENNDFFSIMEKSEGKQPAADAEAEQSNDEDEEEDEEDEEEDSNEDDDENDEDPVIPEY